MWGIVSCFGVISRLNVTIPDTEDEEFDPLDKESPLWPPEYEPGNGSPLRWDTLLRAACRHLEEVDLGEGIHLREGESLAPITQDIHMAQNRHWQSNPNGSGTERYLGNLASSFESRCKCD